MNLVPVNLKRLEFNCPSTVYKWIHNSFARLQNKFPDGLIPGVANGDGNCLFNSTARLLSLDECMAPLIRLGSVLLAVDHYDHLFDVVCTFTAFLYGLIYKVSGAYYRLRGLKLLVGG